MSKDENKNLISDEELAKIVGGIRCYVNMRACPHCGKSVICSEKELATTNCPYCGKPMDSNMPKKQFNTDK